MVYWIFSFNSEGIARIEIKYEDGTEKFAERKVTDFDYNLNALLDELLAEADVEEQA